MTEVTYEGKRKTIEKDRTKNKSSYRSLPLIKPVEELLNQKLKDKKMIKSYVEKHTRTQLMDMYVLMK